MSAFPQTYWSLIQRARGASRSALNLIAQDYQEPVRNFLRRSGFTPEDAEDLAQEVFLIVCDPEFLRQADATKGKFRTLVLLVTKNVMNGEWRKRYAKKRRGKAVSLDATTVHEMLAAPLEDDGDFDREWWAALIQTALEKLKAENPRRHEILHRHKSLGQPHERIAQELSTTAVHVNNEVRAAKKRVREVLLDLVQGYCSSPGEYEAEVALLRRAIS